MAASGQHQDEHRAMITPGFVLKYYFPPRNQGLLEKWVLSGLGQDVQVHQEPLRRLGCGEAVQTAGVPPRRGAHLKRVPRLKRGHLAAVTVKAAAKQSPPNTFASVDS